MCGICYAGFCFSTFHTIFSGCCCYFCQATKLIFSFVSFSSFFSYCCCQSVLLFSLFFLYLPPNRFPLYWTAASKRANSRLSHDSNGVVGKNRGKKTESKMSLGVKQRHRCGLGLSSHQRWKPLHWLNQLRENRIKESSVMCPPVDVMLSPSLLSVCLFLFSFPAIVCVCHSQPKSTNGRTQTHTHSQMLTST